MKIIVAILIISFFLLPKLAHAEMSTNELLERYDKSNSNDKSNVEFILQNLQAGMLTVNIEMIIRKSQGLFCQPKTLALTGKQLIEMIRERVRLHPNDGASLAQIVLLSSLEDTFPCQNQNENEVK